MERGAWLGGCAFPLISLTHILRRLTYTPKVSPDYYWDSSHSTENCPQGFGLFLLPSV